MKSKLLSTCRLLVCLGCLLPAMVHAQLGSLREGAYSSEGYIFHPTFPRSFNTTKYITALGNNTYVINYVADFSANDWSVQFSIDANNKLINWTPLIFPYPVPASGYMTVDNPGGFAYSSTVQPGTAPYLQSAYNNKYDPTTKTLYLHYGYTSGATSQNQYSRQIYEKLTFLASQVKLTSMVPASGTSGTVISVKGKFLDQVAYAGFGKEQSDSLWITSDTTMRIVVGAGQTGKLHISNNYYSDSLAQFTYFNPNVPANTQWKDLGTLPATRNKYTVNMVVSKANIPYIVYVDSTNSVVVKKYTPITGWQNAGTNVSTGKSSNPVIAIDTLNTPYIAYYDSTYKGYRVKKLVNTTWANVGSVTFTRVIVSNPDLVTGYNGSPFLSGKDSSQNFVVYKFDGTAWTNTGLQEPGIFEMSMAIDRRTNTPYVFGSNYGFSGNISGFVKKFNGATWELVGDLGQTNIANIFYPTISIDRAGQPVIAMQDDNLFERISVYRFNGTTWNLMGTERFSKTRSYFLSLAIDKNNYPSVAFQDGSYNKGGTVMKLNPTALWSKTGTRGFTEQAYFTQHSYTVDSGNVPLLAFTDKNFKIRVMVYNPLKPNLGKDSVVNICLGGFADLTSLYTIPAYASSLWNTPKPNYITQSGTYTLIVYNTYGMSDTATVTVTVNPKPSLGKDTTVTICRGSVANLTTLYNTGSYASVKWSTTRPDSVTVAGVYTLIVTNTSGCKDTAAVMVNVNAVTATLTLTNPACFGVSNGFIKIVAAGGKTPYSYRLNSTGVYGTTSTFTGLAAGSYTVYIKDAIGCEVNYTVTLTQPAAITIGIAKVNERCPGAMDGKITVTPTGGTSPYTYRLGATGPFVSGNVFSNLAAGNYRVYVKDAKNCVVYSSSITISRTSATCLMLVKENISKIPEVTHDLQIFLSPNPSANHFVLTTKSGRPKPIIVSVIDINGKILYTYKSLAGQQLSIGKELPTGIYHIEARQGEIIKTLKAIKIK